MSHIPLSDARWDAILRDFRNSRLTHAEFCRRRGISLHTFRKRLYQAPLSKHVPADERPSESAAPRAFGMWWHLAIRDVVAPGH